MSQKNATNITEIEKEILKAIKDLRRCNKTPTFSGIVREVKIQLGITTNKYDSLVTKAIYKLNRDGRIVNFGLNKYGLRRCSQTETVVNNEEEEELGSESVLTYVSTNESMNVNGISIATADEEQLNRNNENDYDDNNANVMVIQFEDTCENSEENLTDCRENIEATTESAHKLFENLEATTASCQESFALQIEEMLSQEKQVLENAIEVSQYVQKNNVEEDSKLESKISESFNSTHQLEVKHDLKIDTMKTVEEEVLEILAFSSTTFIVKNETTKNTPTQIILEDNEMNSSSAQISLNSNIMAQANIEQHENNDDIASSVSSVQSCADNSNFLTASIVRPFRRYLSSFFYGVNLYLRDMLNPLSTLNSSVVEPLNAQSIELNSQNVIVESTENENTNDVWLSSSSIEDNEQ